MIWWIAAAGAAELTGTVTGPDGPVAGATIVAYDLRVHGVLGTTDADGRYAVTVEPGTWRVRVLPANGSTAAESWVGDGVDLCTATPIEVVDTATADAALVTGGVVAGVVLRADGSPAVGFAVTVEPADDTLAFEGRATVTDAAGAFSVPGLHPEGAFTVEISGELVPTQYLPGVYSTVDAAVFAPGTGTAAPSPSTLLEGISVSGEILADGEPLPAGTAQVYVPSQLRSALVTDGDYEAVGLPTGELLVWAIADGYATTYHPSSDRPDERVVVSEEGAAVTLDIAMPLASRLEGRLPGEGPFTSAAVVAYNSDRTVGVGGIVESDGTFSIGGLHGGLYTVAVYAEENGLVAGVVTGPAGDVVYDVPAEAALDAGEIPVPFGGTVTGVVRDKYTGEGIYGAYMHAESRATGAIATTTTLADGTYALPGLGAGDYVLWVDYSPACDVDPDWLPRWYPDNPTDSLAAAQPLVAGGELQWDAEVAPDFDHDGMDDVWEGENGLEVGRDDSAEDPDGDGFTNLEEYFLGTDPTVSTGGDGCGCATSRASPTWVVLLGLIFRRRRRCTASSRR